MERDPGVRIATATWRAIGGTVTGMALHPSGLAQRHGWLVIVQANDGAWGVGEASPLPGYSPEPPAAVAASLPMWCAAAVGQPIARPEDVWAMAASVAEPSLRFAVETALWTVLAFRAHRPLHQLLHTALTPTTVPLRFLTEVDVAAVQALWGRGVRNVKWKVGTDCDDELARLRAVREIGRAHV